MISNKQAKLIRSLRLKKFREKTGLFIVEGDKMVDEYILNLHEEVVLLAGLETWLKDKPGSYTGKAGEVISLTEPELKALSSLSTPHNSLALVRRKTVIPVTNHLRGVYSIALDEVRDPGNMGTIIRTASWFGIKNIICSTGCVDIYNPKVIQSTMGGLINTRVFYTDLQQFLYEADRNGIGIYATMLNGTSIENAEFGHEGILVFGNESKGIAPELLPPASKKILIPKSEHGGSGVESLNIASSVAIFCHSIYQSLR